VIDIETAFRVLANAEVEFIDFDAIAELEAILEEQRRLDGD
jgi:hypothetical protein